MRHHISREQGLQYWKKDTEDEDSEEDDKAKKDKAKKDKAKKDKAKKDKTPEEMAVIEAKKREKDIKRIPEADFTQRSGHC
ncbi:uncharacterized protein LDX57_002141 [Aspergillus melleus]|uniref:uncharacterized protein n=1 Tax=Aspergillus melleus TaxID=138277 RepID=UPI001E8D434F|nr:uncharacterized protein LDX57_002141 [Aspergillus melleus]KAH8424390.1 hypothetical protein LDX57_002141 [Aspergillus melleus]